MKKGNLFQELPAATHWSEPLIVRERSLIRPDLATWPIGHQALAEEVGSTSRMPPGSVRETETPS